MERSFSVPFCELPNSVKDNFLPDPRRGYVEESPPQTTKSEPMMFENRVSVAFRDGNKSPVVFHNGEMLQGVAEVHAYAGGRIEVVKDGGQRLAAKGSALVPAGGPGQLPAEDDEPEVNLGKAAADVARYFDGSDEDRYEDWPQRR